MKPRRLGFMKHRLHQAVVGPILASLDGAEFIFNEQGASASAALASRLTARWALSTALDLSACTSNRQRVGSSSTAMRSLSRYRKQL